LSIISYDSFALLARAENLDLKLSHLKVSNHITVETASDAAVIITADFPVQRFDFHVFTQRIFRIRTTTLIAAIRDVRIQAVAGCDAICSAYRLLHNMEHEEC
jgi:hypothetical protein